MSDRAPLTPPDCDLQDFPFMPLHVARLRDSDMASEEAPEACWYGVLLWAASWHQLPAGSLPDSDAVLTKLIGLGRDVRTFAKHKAGAMRGFVKCSDGRLYHPVVAEEVIRSWNSKLQQRWRTECARIKKQNQRNETDLPLPTFEEFISGSSPNGPDAVPRDVPRDTEECPSGNAIQEKETGTETGTSTVVADGTGEIGADWPAGDATQHAKLLAKIADTPRLDPARQGGLTITVGRLDAWRRMGASWTYDVVPTVLIMSRKPGDGIASWKYFDTAIAQSTADNRQTPQLPSARQAHERPNQPSAKRVAREDNLARAFAGSEAAAREREGCG